MAIPTRQMSRPQVRPMQPFRQQQSQALRPALQQPLQQPMQRAMQQPMQRAQTMQQPMQQRSQPMQQQQRGPMVQRPQAMQPTPTRVQQPMQRGQLNAPAVMPNEVPSRPGGGGVMKMPETSGLEPNPGSNFGMPGSTEYSVAPEHREEYRRALEKQRQLDAGRAQREGALFNPPPPQKPVLQPGEVDMPIGHAGIGFGGSPSPLMEKPMQVGGGMQMEKPMQVGGGGVGMMMPNNPNEIGMTMGAFKRGGKVTAVKKYAKGGTVKSTPVKASSRGDGIAQRGKTKGKIY